MDNIIIIVLLLFFICFLYYKYYKLKKDSENNYYQKLSKEKENEISQLNQKIETIKEEVGKELNRLNEVRNFTEKEVEQQKDLIQREISLWKQQELDKIEKENKEARAELLNSYITFKGDLENESLSLLDRKNDLTSEITQISAELLDYQEKRDAINKEILQRRAIEEKQDFYSINLSADSLDDIKIIQDIREKLHKQEILDKIVYDNYVAKPVKEMCKRVLEGKDPTGIYKITNIKTQEIYIGKSTGVATRWTNHIKSACGLAGVADSQFQRALKKYGIENWTFELLEECPKDKLTEREKFYISFYDTINYGYNQRLG